MNGSTVSTLVNNLTPGQSYSLQIGSFTAKGVGVFSPMKSLHFRPDLYPTAGNDNGGSNVDTNGHKGKSGNDRGGSGSSSSSNKHGHHHHSHNNGKLNFGGGNDINFGAGSHENGHRETGDEIGEGYNEDRNGGADGVATFGGTTASNEFLTEAWFVALIGSLIFVLLLVFVFALYLRRCQLRKDSDKLKGT